MARVTGHALDPGADGGEVIQTETTLVGHVGVRVQGDVGDGVLLEEPPLQHLRFARQELTVFGDALATDRCG